VGEPVSATATDGQVIARHQVARRRRMRWEPGLIAAGLVILLVIAWIAFPGLFTSQDPLTGNLADRLQAPSGAHLFGTDELGRDVFARVVYGSRVSVASAALAVLLGLAAGGPVGLVAGFAGGWTDDVLMRVMDLMLAIPGILLSMAVITAWGEGTVKVAFAVGLSSVATIARTMRSEVVRVRIADYVDAARAGGVRWHVILARHVLPNSWRPVLVLATLQFGYAILAVASLSFLGYGPQPPAPDWGAMVSDGSNYLATSWWLVTLPGIVIVALVLSVNHVARRLGARRGRR
jgi:peptide/nickel transport system permease protein